MGEEEEEGDTREFEGLLVEIHGVGCEVEPYLREPEETEVESSGIQPDGKVGRCLEWRPEDGKYVIQLLDSRYLLLPEENLREWEPPPVEEGGFDVLWPSALPDGPSSIEALPAFAGLVAEVIAQRGWCLIQMLVDDVTRDEAVTQAVSLPHTAALKAEMLPDYLGRGGRGKISILEHQGLHGLMLDEESYPWALAEYDQQLTYLAKALAPLTAESMGFTVSGRRKGMVWAPSSAGEDERLEEVISEEDIEAGVLEAHLKFMRQRKLCFVNWIDNKGGELILHPREDVFPRAAPTSLPLTPGKLLIFRCDQMSYTYRPLGENAVSLTTWVVDESSTVPDMNLAFLDVGDIQQRSEMMGIRVGPPMPTGYRMHAMQMHTRIPGGVHDVFSLACLFISGTDGFEKIPATRFDTDIYCTHPDEEKDMGRSYVIHASMLSHAEVVYFDNTFFNMTEDDTRHMGPTQRLILEDGYTTLHMAGFTRETLRGRKMASYVGDTGTDWNPMLLLKPPEGGPRNPYSGAIFGNCEACPTMYRGVSNHYTAGRLAHTFGLVGTACSIDTACSASLVGVSVAVQGLRRPEKGQGKTVTNKGEVDALCMGINTLMSPFTFIGLCGATMLSKGGRCFTFDYSASGYARGDGFGAMYISPGAAEEDFAAQLSCFMGVRVNQDGRSATLTAPNGVAQQACIRESMREAGVVASQITVAECHGTGTALGDPIEVGALRGVMEPRETPLLTTSAKSNIGHQEACAGMIGLVKCCLLVMSSQAAPNVHLSILNPHLDVDGFPCFFESEVSDTRLNSNYAGVSSFGFSGTNARADVWSQCKVGPRKAVKIDFEKVDQVHVRCPVTMGLIEHLTGEPITKTFRSRKKYKADVLREEFAPYDISAYAYEGSFRYRREALLDSLDEDLDPEIGVFICGSWSGYTRQELMGRQGHGWYVCTVALGEVCYERFWLTINEDPGLAIFPVISNASQRITVEGPGEGRGGRCWMIDGRDLGVPAGTLYEVRFRWHSERMSVEWEKVSGGLPLCPVLDYKHIYSLVGTFAPGAFVEMRRVEGEEGVWEGVFKLGNTGTERFQLARDKDLQQLIYPAKPDAIRTQVGVCGPDEFGGSKCWLVRGPTNDRITVQLRVVEAKVSVTISSEVKGSKVWEGKTGWERHAYSVVGSFTQWMPAAMVPDPEEPGTFRGFGKVGERWSPELQAYAEFFQLCVEEDRDFAWYPLLDASAPGEVIVLGPDSGAKSRNWMILSPYPNMRFEVLLNLAAIDRRRLVTINWMTDFSEGS